MPPDIFIVMVDDLGHIPDDRVLRRLPNVRRLWIDGGLRFLDMHAETPLCCPAWATLLTGRHTLAHGVTRNKGNLFDPTGSLAARLGEVGYHTLLVGKYLVGYSGTPTPPGWDRVAMSRSRLQARFIVDGTPRSYEGRHNDDIIRRFAVRWLRDAPEGAPVFALVSPHAPHRAPGACARCRFLPNVMKSDRGAPQCAGVPRHRPPSYALAPYVPAGYWEMPDWPRGWPMRRICESMLVVDRMVGQLVDAQSSRGRPAWFLLLSDNGMSWGQKGFPLKRVPTATRLPFYLSGPGVATGSTGALATNLDIAPTLAELAGIPFPERGGRSLVPQAADPGRPGHDEILEVMPADGTGTFIGWSALRTREWRLIRWDTGIRELYRPAADPWELDDLADQHPLVVAELDLRLDDLLRASASTGPP